MTSGNNAVTATSWDKSWPPAETSEPRALSRLRTVIVVLLGPALLFSGWVQAGAAIRAHLDFGGARRAQATVTEADYAESGRQASKIVVSLSEPLGGTATIDDPGTAPDYLSIGSAQEVLVDPARPGHALFPGQLNWWHLAYPGGYFLLAGIGTLGYTVAAGVRTWRRRGRRRWGVVGRADVPTDGGDPRP